MEIKIIKLSQNELKFEVIGESHTLCNLLEKVLLEDEDVEMAGYDIPHPLIANPIIYIRTRGGKTPEEALREAVKKILEAKKELKESFEEALEEWREKSMGK